MFLHFYRYFFALPESHARANIERNTRSAMNGIVRNPHSTTPAGSAHEGSMPHISHGVEIACFSTHD